MICLNFLVILHAFESALLKTNSCLPTVHSFPLKMIACVSQKNLLNKYVVQITPTCVKRRHCTEAEMNAESFEHGYQRKMETALVVQVLKVGHWDSSATY